MNPVYSPARHDLGAKLGFAAYGVIHRMTGLGGRVDERLGCMEMMLSAILQASSSSLGLWAVAVIARFTSDSIVGCLG